MKKLMIALLLVVLSTSCSKSTYDVIVSGKVLTTDLIITDVYKEFKAPKDSTAVNSIVQFRYSNYLPYFIVNRLGIPELKYDVTDLKVNSNFVAYFIWLEGYVIEDGVKINIDRHFSYNWGDRIEPIKPYVRQ